MEAAAWYSLPYSHHAPIHYSTLNYPITSWLKNQEASAYGGT